MPQNVYDLEDYVKKNLKKIKGTSISHINTHSKIFPFLKEFLWIKKNF